jgi:hypothetical protein
MRTGFKRLSIRPDPCIMVVTVPIPSQTKLTVWPNGRLLASLWLGSIRPRQLSFKLPPITNPSTFQRSRPTVGIINIVNEFSALRGREFHCLREYRIGCDGTECDLAARVLNLTGQANIELNSLRENWIWLAAQVLNLISCERIEFHWLREYWIWLAVRVLNSTGQANIEFNSLREYWI